MPKPFVLCVLISDALDNNASLSFSDLLYGLERYKDIALNEFNIDIKLIRNKTTDELINVNEKFDGVISCWGNGIGNNIETFKTSIFIDDCHWWEKWQLTSRLGLFNKVDIIFTPSYRTLTTYDIYKNIYKEIQHKFVSLYWWAVDECFTFDMLWKDRKDSILIYGAFGQCYNLRCAIIKSKHQSIELLNHCGYNDFSHQYHGSSLLKYLSGFKGGIGTSANQAATQYDQSIIHPLDYTLKKPFEILGCGALGFLEPTKDFDDLGFIPYVHYIPITTDDYDKWDYIKKSDAEDIAKTGMEFVKNNHSTKNRAITILSTLKEKWL
jgi:hypothetical protein